MNSLSASTLLNSIDQTIRDIDSISGKDALTDAYLAKFLTVYISGMFEEVIENSLTDFIQRNTSRTEVVAYARKTVERSFQNPNSEKIITLISNFDNQIWVTTLKNMSTARIALDSIILNKNNIAHGHPSTITLIEIKKYYTTARLFIEKFDDLLI